MAIVGFLNYYVSIIFMLKVVLITGGREGFGSPANQRTWKGKERKAVWLDPK